MKLMKLKAQRLNSGQVVLAATIFFLVAFLLIVGGVTLPVMADVSNTRESFRSAASYALAEGLIEDVTYRFKEGLPVSATESIAETSTSASAVITAPVPDEREMISTGNTSDSIRKIQVRLVVGSGAAFNFGVQTDVGGVIMENSSSVKGNLYSNGAATGTGSSLVRGEVVSAGPGGLILGIHATGSAYAHEIRDSWVEGDAYYQIISGTTVDGSSYSGSPNQPTTLLPISDSQVADWEAGAELSGVIGGADCSTGTYEISSNRTIGPVKVECNLRFSGNNTYTLAGNIWVEGDITVRNTPDFYAAAALGNKSVMMIADNPTDRISSSRIFLEQNPDFFGTGTGGTYIMLLSMNNDAEMGGSTPAIDIQQGAEGDILVYAGHGEIRLQQSALLKEVTGYRVRLQNNAEVIYETGLGSLLFTSGPGGGFVIEEWVEEL
jgi:hypothetical protein